MRHIKNKYRKEGKLGKHGVSEVQNAEDEDDNRSANSEEEDEPEPVVKQPSVTTNKIVG